MQPTLLFDLDGTLTDSRPGIVNCIRFALEKMGVKSPDDLSFALGPPLHDSFSRLLATDDVSKIDLAVEHYRERFRDVGMFENSVYPGIAETLEALAARGHGLYVATSKPHVFAKIILEHFGLSRFFKTIHGSELDGVRTDKRELLAYVLESESIAAPRAWMIGDRSHDVRGAKHNRIPVIGVLWGYGDAKELHDADHLVATPADLLATVSG